MNDYGQNFVKWRAATGTLWDQYVAHEFVAGLANGTLPKSAFFHYLVQDYLFLDPFFAAWALAVTKAGTVDEMGRRPPPSMRW